MASSEYEGGTGGKFFKRPLRRTPTTPYDRPPLAVRGTRVPLPAAESRGNWWLSNLVDPASRVIASSASRLFASVFRKRLAASPGEICNTNEAVQTFLPEVRMPDDSSFDKRPSEYCVGSGSCGKESISGTGNIFELEQLVKQKRFSRTETERLTELLNSRVIETSTLASEGYKSQGKLNKDSNVDTQLSELVLNRAENETTSEFEDQRKHLVAAHRKVSSRVKVDIPGEGFGSPLEIGKAYMGSMSTKQAPSLHVQQSQEAHRDTVLPVRNMQSNAVDVYKSSGDFPTLPDRQYDFMSPKPQGRSSLYRLPRSPYCKASMMSNPMKYSPYNGSHIRSRKQTEWTPSSSNIRHSGHVHAAKRGGTASDEGGFGDTRRVRQKYCFNDLRSSRLAESSPTSLYDQEYINEIDLKDPENVDGRLPSSSLHSVPQSTQMARKILHQLDKLTPPQKMRSEKKATSGDASISNTLLGVLHEGDRKFKGNYCSPKLENVPGRSGFGEPSSSTLARIGSSDSPNKDKAKEVEDSPVPSISGAELISSSFHMNSLVTSSSDAYHSMRSINFNNPGNEPILQSAPDDKDESTKAKHSVASSVKESREKPLFSSAESVPTSELLHNETDTNAPKSSTGNYTGFKLPAVHTSNTLPNPHIFSAMASTTLAAGVSPGFSTFRFDSTESTANKSVKMGTYESVRARNTMTDHPSKECDSGVSTTPALSFEKPVSSTPLTSTEISASSNNRISSSAEPRFQFGSGNSTIYSFTGLSAVSSNVGTEAPKFQFGSNTSACYTFTGVAASSSHGVGVSNPVSSSLNPVEKGTGSLLASYALASSENGICGARTLPASGGSIFSFASSSTQISATNFGTTAALTPGTRATFPGNGNAAFSTSSVSQFAASDSKPTFGIGSSLSSTCSSQFGFASSGSSFNSFTSSSLSQTAPTTFPSMFSPSTAFSFGLMPANSTSSMPFASSSGLTWPFASTQGATSTTSLSPSQPVNAEDSRSDGDCQAAPMDPKLSQPTLPQAAPSGAQVFQFGNFHNKPPQNSSPLPESGSFSLGSGGAEKSERKFIRVRRDKRRQ